MSDVQISDSTIEEFKAREAELDAATARPTGEHVVDGKFQSDKYPWCKPNFVPLKVTDPMAQPVLWAYADTRRTVDAEFADDLQAVLRANGYQG